MMNKTDRLIIIFSTGVLIASALYVSSTTYKQNVLKDNAEIEQLQKKGADTFNIHVWKTYHEKEMAVMKEILKELKKKNEDASLSIDHF